MKPAPAVDGPWTQPTHSPTPAPPRGSMSGRKAAAASAVHTPGPGRDDATPPTPAALFPTSGFAGQSAILVPRGRWQVTVPAWLVSLVVHALAVIVLGYVADRHSRGTGAPPGAELVASLNTDAIDGDDFEDELVAAVSPASETSADNGPPDGEQTAQGARALVGEESPVDIRGALPRRAEAGGLGASDLGQATGAGNFTLGGKKGPVRLSGGKARTKVYGVEGEGNSFVYVFDHSASMGGGGGSPLESAKRELLASLADLGDTQQFQIIFYNEKPTQMNLGRSYGGMVLANEQSKRMAERFVRGIIADGGTRHEAALEMAIKLAPDVIFFLTDADEPELLPPQLDRIRRLNGERSTIHTIEFGERRSGARDNFLKRIAQQNGGRYVYIDITRHGER